MKITVEEKLRNMIVDQYGSVQEFAKVTGIKYTTVLSILNRGVNNASVTNIITICRTLGISTDDLSDGKIVPIRGTIQRKEHLTDIDAILAFTKLNIQEYSDLTIDGEKMTKSEVESILDALEIVIGIIRKKRERLQNR